MAANEPAFSARSHEEARVDTALYWPLCLPLLALIFLPCPNPDKQYIHAIIKGAEAGGPQAQISYSSLSWEVPRFARGVQHNGVRVLEAEDKALLLGEEGRNSPSYFAQKKLVAMVGGETS